MRNALHRDIPGRRALEAFCFFMANVQALDGMDAGLLSVATPPLVAYLMPDKGRVYVGQGSALLRCAMRRPLGNW